MTFCLTAPRTNHQRRDGNCPLMFLSPLLVTTRLGGLEGARRSPWCWIPPEVPGASKPVPALQELLQISLNRDKRLSGEEWFLAGGIQKSLWVSPCGNQEMATATGYHSTTGSKVDSDVRVYYTQYKVALFKRCCKVKLF